MPLEIRELVIKASVDTGQEQNGGQASGGVTGDTAAIIAACVDQVLTILKDKAER